MIKRIGILGGTFDPIHNGHLITARFVLEERNLDKIIFIPCNISPHKTEQLSSHPDHRLNMVKLSIENLHYFDYSDYELNKGNISYSLDTIRHLKKYYEQIELIIGYDNLLVFDRWNYPDEIVKLVSLIVMKRKTDIDEKRNRFFDNAILLDTPTIEISSTDIRNRVRINQPIDFLVPEPVKSYIYKNRLYSS